MARKTAEKAEKKKSVDQIQSEDEAKLKVLMKSLEKEHGVGAVQTLGCSSISTFTKWERAIPSGSIGLDIALGGMFRRPDGTWQTGYGPGRILEIYGPEGCGKTTEMGLLIANAQAVGIRCAAGDMEHSWDLDYMRRLGVQTDKLYFYQPSSGTKCLTIADTLLKSGLFGLIVTDSVASLVTDAELAGDVGDSHVAEQARLMSQTLRSMNTYLTTGAQCVLAFTNQERDKIGGHGGKSTPGGRALKFYASNRIELYRSGFLAKGDQKYGQKVHATVIKNKSSPPYRFADFDLIWGQGIDYISELIDISVARGLIDLDGSWYKLNKKPLGQGKEQASEKLRSRPDTCYALYDKVMTRVMADRGLNPDGTRLDGWEEPPVTTMTQTMRPIPGAPATPSTQEQAQEEAELAAEFEGK